MEARLSANTEDGLEVWDIPGKGRGVIVSTSFSFIPNQKVAYFILILLDCCNAANSTLCEF